ncbi:hypothetical protein [Algoriphagus sp.]|jgi:hypothetical protein|uniref:hypothetical protein n=1 Tax=Algoriphagus sp. TaxID=1872435 RepID=UPI002720EBAD|nr:hypothetical protein [Algoriphagus sp.]MDO8965239.1 hypothetical protein [Algoriphagus sp.]MDP3201039.1 hypothetical protein [Algoriphagus sp.]
MKKAYFILIGLIFFFSCSENEEPQGVEETFWVYSYPVQCDHSSNIPSPCLGISYAEEFDFNWPALERIPFEIEGFTFKPTFIQKILVRKIENTTTGDIKRKLIQVLAEEKDNYDLIEGGWKVQIFMGEGLPNEKFPKGQSVSILPGIRMAVSTDGCNQLILEIRKVGPNKILSFGSLTSTAKGCFNELQYPPFPGIGAIFKREGNVLTFYSEEKVEIAVWEKLK